ncbi:MAG: hypothetical protein JSS68_09675 [Actinobacteria bacterium]|nr:hypothetical protein [Actinomycetota bacterium]
MSEGYGSVRSYQRIFSPERCIHQIEGRPVPVPGGVPLRWLGWALGSLVAILALGSGSAIPPTVAAAAAGAGGLAFGDRTAGLLAAAAAAVGCVFLGLVLGVLDWPVRLVVLPIAIATAATQATPDGRRPERYAVSWLALRLAPPRRSLGRGLPPIGATRDHAPRLWFGSDQRGPRLRPARVIGPGVVFFVRPVGVRRPLLGGGLLAFRPGRLTPRRQVREAVELSAGEALQVRP